MMADPKHDRYAVRYQILDGFPPRASLCARCRRWRGAGVPDTCQPAMVVYELKERGVDAVVVKCPYFVERDDG